MVVHNSGLQNTSVSAGQTRANVREAVGNTRQTGRTDTEEQRIQQQTGIGRTDQKQEVRETGETREEAEARRLEALARREEERENVIARSEDGDTLQVEPENADMIDEGIGEVTARQQMTPPPLPPEVEEIEAPEVEPPEIPPVEIAPPPPPPVTVEVETQTAEVTAEATEAEEDATGAATAEQTAEAAEEEDDAAVQQTSTNFAGISDDRLEQMYLRGEISRYDYETEIESREAEREQLAEDRDAFSERMNELEGVGRKTENGAEAIRDATSERANDTLTAEQRLDIIENLQRDNVEKVRREEESSSVWQSQFLA